MKLLKMPTIENVHEGLQYVKSGAYVLILDEADANVIVNAHCDTFTIADELFYSSNIGFILPKQSPYVNAFSRA